MKRTTIMLSVALLLVLLPVGLVSASPAIHIEGWSAAGQLLYPPAVTPFANDNKCIIDFGFEWELYGDIEAVCDTYNSITVHGPCGCPDCRRNAKVYAECTGTVAGYGNIDDTFELKGTQQQWFDDAGQSYVKKQLVLSGGTGELANLHGVMHVLGMPGVAGTYDGIITFGQDK
ncbi:MAG: hypothetical protein JXM73_24720 [Anaerolineae bacterium]|nr:hypothetical protein [Anaerolineae bacterium]